MGWAAPAAAQVEGEYSLNKRIGGWQIIGGSGVNSCLLLSSEFRGTRMAAFSTPGRNEVTFSIENGAWRALAEGELRLQAAFLNAENELLDLWNLSAVADQRERPVIRWTIDRAANDNASWFENFRSSHRLLFLVDEVPIADFALMDSAAALDELFACRSALRLREDFDPFAG
jgi:hypothetical protein